MSNLLTLATVGAAVYGEHWQLPLARELGISGRCMRYYVAGREVPAHILEALPGVLNSAAARHEKQANSLRHLLPWLHTKLADAQ